MKKPLILEAKLIPPDCSRMLLRDRLIDDFRNNDECLTVICANAGFGKTMLMAQFCELIDSHGVWYTLDSTDRDMAVFMAYLVEGVNRHLPEFEASMEQALMRAGVDEGDWHGYMTVFIHEISSASEKPFVFFLDEFRWVNNSENVTEAMNFLIEHLPTASRVVITSRIKPSISLGRLRAQRKLREIFTDELRFTIEEIAGLFRGCCAGKLDKEELKAWYDATEGWPVAILLSMSLLDEDHRKPEDVNLALLGGQGVITEYLAEELWSGLDDELKKLLMETSLLETVDAEICDQVLTVENGESSVSGHLQDLSMRNMMIICLEDNRRYRYQPMVRQFLREKLNKSTGNSRIAELHGGYGQAYAEHGRYELAIYHFLESRSPDLATDIIEIRGKELLESGQYNTLKEWLSRLPDNTIRSRPWLSYYVAKTSKHFGDNAGAEHWYRMAEDGFGREGDDSGLYTCFFSMAEYFFMQNKYGQSLEKANGSLKYATTPSQKVESLSWMAMQNKLLGSGQVALELLNQAAEICDDSMNDTLLTLEVDALMYKWLAGEFSELHEQANRKQKESSPDTPIFTRFQILCWKVFPLNEMGRYEDALAAIEEKSDYLGDEEVLLQAAFEFIRGVVLLNVGDGKSGQKKIEAIYSNTRDTSILPPFCSPNYLGAYLRRHGDLDNAIVENSKTLHYREGGDQYAAASSLVNLGANRLRREHDDPEGFRNLKEAQALAVKHGYKYISTQVHFIFAWAALEAGDDGRALVEIGDALRLAAFYQHNNFIIQEGRISTGLLSFAYEHDIERDYLKGILPSIGLVALEDFARLQKSDSPNTRAEAIAAMTAIGGVKAAPYIRRSLRDRDNSVSQAAIAELSRLRASIDRPEKILTRRENQVMEMIAEGLSNTEIAERLFISVPTTKTHVSSIFRKLGLTSRSQVAVITRKKEKKTEYDDGNADVVS